MNFKEGQKVKVKSKEELLKWFEENEFIEDERGSFVHRNNMRFLREMFAWCNCVLTIKMNFITHHWYNHDVVESSWCFLGDWLLPACSTFVEVDDEF